MLELDTLVHGIGTFRSRCPTGTSNTGILVVAHRVFGKTTEGLLLMLPCSLDPSTHVVHHLFLNLGIVVIEVRMEETLQDGLSSLIHVDRCVVPSSSDVLHSMFLMRTKTWKHNRQ